MIKGTLGADISKAVDDDGIMIGRGEANVFHGDAGNDHIKVADLSFGLLEGGIDTDVLHLDGK